MYSPIAEMQSHKLQTFNDRRECRRKVNVCHWPSFVRQVEPYVFIIGNAVINPLPFLHNEIYAVGNYS